MNFVSVTKYFLSNNILGIQSLRIRACFNCLNLYYLENGHPVSLIPLLSDETNLKYPPPVHRH